MEGLTRVLVTGGSGMLGFEIVKQLASRGIEVRILDLVPPDPWPGELPQGTHLDVRIGDVARAVDVRMACQGVDAVIHTAAAVWNVRTPASTYEKVNVWGTANVIEACRGLGIQRLVYTSSLDVVVDGRIPTIDGDESLPYPRRMPADPYSRTKIMAEKMALAASGPGLATCSLRPVGMYGPRDKYHIGNFVAMARKGMSMRLGDGSARFSHVYSENAAWAHVLAAGALRPGSTLDGQAYFVCDHYPAENLFTFMEPFLTAMGLPIARRSIAYGLAYPLAAVAEVFAPHSNFNRFAVIQTCVDHTFIHAKAARDFGYQPIVSRDEAFNRTVEWLRRGDQRAAGLDDGRGMQSGEPAGTAAAAG